MSLKLFFSDLKEEHKIDFLFIVITIILGIPFVLFYLGYFFPTYFKSLENIKSLEVPFFIFSISAYFSLGLFPIFCIIELILATVRFFQRKSRSLVMTHLSLFLIGIGLFFLIFLNSVPKGK